MKGRHDYARSWKERTGGRVLGYFCTYVPEEIVYAAGILPVRIMGSHEPQDVTEPYLYGGFCPFCRDCLAQGLLGRYEYVEGVAIARSCVHIYQTFDSWQRHLPVSYSHYLSMPSRVTIPSAPGYLRAELVQFQRSLEEWTGAPIPDESLDRAIDIYNTNRRLMREIYELRRGDSPPISGTQAMEMVLSGMFMDKEEHNGLLQELLAQLPGPGGNGSVGTRIMVLGSENDDTEVIRLIESLGGRVVIDDHCSGSRYFWGEVVPGEDRLAALAARYLEKPPCPQKDLVERHRLEHILRLAQEYRVEAAVLIHEKFCDPHEFDNPAIESMFRERGIPCLTLELDTTVPAGQFRTRLEAFLEMLQLEIV